MDDKKKYMQELEYQSVPVEKAVEDFINKINAVQTSETSFTYGKEKWFIDFHPYDHSDDIIISVADAEKYDKFLLVKHGGNRIRIPGWCDKKLLKSTSPRDIYRNEKEYYMVKDTNISDLKCFHIPDQNIKLKQNFILNKQFADNLGHKEMINGVLAGLHHYAKESGIYFKDINQKDECQIGEQKVKVYTRDAQSDEDMLIRDSYFQNNPKIDLYICCKIKAGTYWYVGYVDKKLVSATRVVQMIGSESDKASGDIRRIFAEQYLPLSDVFEIYEEEKEEETIVPQDYVPLHLHTEFCIIGDSYIKRPNNNAIRIAKLYNMHLADKKLPRIYDGDGNSTVPKNIFCNGKKEVFEIITEDGKKIQATSKHQFKTPNGWKRLSELKLNDEIIVCDYAKDISVRQKRKSQKKQFNDFLESGKKTRFKKGNKPSAPFKKGNKPWNDKKKLIDKKHLTAKEKIALANMSKKKKEWWDSIDKKTKEKIIKKFTLFKKGHIPHNKGKKGWGRWLHKKYPESHPNYVLAKNGRISVRQKEMYKIIKKYFSDATLNLRVETERSFRFLDVAVPSLQIDFEYDGKFWHSSEERILSDKKRDKELKQIGWKTIRINNKNFCTLRMILEDIKCIQK